VKNLLEVLVWLAVANEDKKQIGERDEIWE